MTTTGTAGDSVTVAICVKNGGRTIAMAVESICTQSLLPRKLLVIDDSSTDNTREEIEKAESRGLTIEIVPNDGKGLFDGRNSALKGCDTEFLAFIDADCEADSEWVKGILKVFSMHPDVAAGTGSHPQIGKANWVSCMHRLWFVVEGKTESGYTDGVMGANSYFRASALREVGGWISLPLANAEDVYISEKLSSAGYKMWLQIDLIVRHHYARDFFDFLKKTFNSGYAITVMMQKAGWRNYWFWYTLSIPLVAASAIISVALGVAGYLYGWVLFAAVLVATFLFNLRMFKSPAATLPRWALRWVVIWGYSLGIIKALIGR